MKEKKKMGRPKIELNWEEFNRLCQLQCTLREVAAWFECSEDTIEARLKEEHNVTFPEYLALKGGKGKISLRRKQYDTAMSGNTTMLIWLGKQWLGQSDKQDISQHNVNESYDDYIKRKYNERTKRDKEESGKEEKGDKEVGS